MLDYTYTPHSLVGCRHFLHRQVIIGMGKNLMHLLIWNGIGWQSRTMLLLFIDLNVVVQCYLVCLIYFRWFQKWVGLHCNKWFVQLIHITANLSVLLIFLIHSSFLLYLHQNLYVLNVFLYKVCYFTYTHVKKCDVKLINNVWIMWE